MKTSEMVKPLTQLEQSRNFFVSVANQLLEEQFPGSGRKYVIDMHNSDVVDDVITYFSKALPSRLDKSKSLLIQGPTGTGKTFIFQVMDRIIKMLPQWYNYQLEFVECLGLEDRFRQKKYEYFERLKGNTRPNEPVNKIKTHIILNDLGLEQVIKFKNQPEIDLVSQILWNRDLNNLPFHITTNLNATMIEERYGTRIRDRLRGRCNLLKLHGESRRD